MGNLSSFFRYLHLDNNQLSGSVPPELGNLTRLLQFLLHNNPLGGNLPLELISLALDSFWFNNTSLCEPNDTAFQAWLADIPDLSGTGVTCGIEYEYIYLPLILR